MKTIGVLIIILLIFILCISSSIGGIVYYNEINGEIKIYNEAIDNYNRDYNINYDTKNNKLITDNDLNKMETTECVVKSEPESKDITVNNNVHKLSYAKISYYIKNYYKDEKLTKLEAIDGASIYLKKELQSVNAEQLIPVETYLITKEPLEKLSSFKIYYDPNGRVAPPYILSSYIETIPKKGLLFESITSKFSN